MTEFRLELQLNPTRCYLESTSKTSRPCSNHQLKSYRYTSTANSQLHNSNHQLKHDHDHAAKLATAPLSNQLRKEWNNQLRNTIN